MPYQSPNRRPPDATHAARVRLAAEAKAKADAELARAEKELKAAVVAALKAGGSHREVAAAAGVHERTVLRWGHANGWPTEEQKAERASRTREAQREALGLTEVHELLERHSRNLAIDDEEEGIGDTG